MIDYNNTQLSQNFMIVLYLNIKILVTLKV